MAQKSCHDQAFDTFRDAAIVIRWFLGSTCQGQGETESTSSAAKMLAVNNYKRIYAMLQQAYRRAANPVPSSSGNEIQVVSDDEAFRAGNVPHADTFLLCKGESGTPAHVYTMLRISIIDCDASLESKHYFDYYIPIILLNLAIASTFQAQSCESPSASRKLRDDAVMILCLCQNSLEVLICEHIECDPILTHQISFVAMHVLQALIPWLAQDEKRKSRADFAAESLRNLCFMTTFHETEVSALVLETKQVYASAA